LESLLFDFDSGWGGGSVTVGQFLAPSNHQIQLLKTQMQGIQKYRLVQTDLWLSRSRRMDKLMSSNSNTYKKPPDEVLAQEALRIAKNADYLSSHLAFTSRLCDIAENLRFLAVAERPHFLQTELAKLNASGTMGGDPLNKLVQTTDHTRVVRIPTTEGHVFRSKERTPVLLLVEINDEGAELLFEEELSANPMPNKNNKHNDESKEAPPVEIATKSEEAENKDDTIAQDKEDAEESTLENGEASDEAEVAKDAALTEDEVSGEKVIADSEEVKEAGTESKDSEPKEDNAEQSEKDSGETSDKGEAAALTEDEANGEKVIADSEEGKEAGTESKESEPKEDNAEQAEKDSGETSDKGEAAALTEDEANGEKVIADSEEAEEAGTECKESEPKEDNAEQAEKDSGETSNKGEAFEADEFADAENQGEEVAAEVGEGKLPAAIALDDTEEDFHSAHESESETESVAPEVGSPKEKKVAVRSRSALGGSQEGMSEVSEKSSRRK
jgi:hypothetical protein